MGSKVAPFLLDLYAGRDRQRALAYERERRASTGISAAHAHGDALQRLLQEPSITMGLLRPDGSAIKVDEAIALAHSIVVGSTGSGKTRFIIGLLLGQIKRGLAAHRKRGGGLAIEAEVIDPKGETAQLLMPYLATLWLAADDATREVLASAVYTIDWTRDFITPSAPYDNRAQVVSDAYLAHLHTDVTIESSKQEYSETLRQVLFMWTWLLIDLRFPPNFAFAERFFRDAPYRKTILAKVSSGEVRQYFHACESVIARQTQDAFLRRLQRDLSFPENRFAIGVPPENLDGLQSVDDARLVVGNYGCSNVLPLSLGLSRATWRAIRVLLDAPRRRRRTQKTIVFEELALLLSASTELMEILMTGLRTLRSVRVGLLLASQDLASSLPKNAVRNIVLNTRWSATFQSRRDEAELLFPHVVFDSTDRRSSTDRHRDFLRDVETMPRQEFWLAVKGGYPALPARSLDLPDPRAFANGRSDEDLTEVFHREIGRRSMLSTKRAAEYIAAWEARVVNKEEVDATKNTRINEQRIHSRTFCSSLDVQRQQETTMKTKGESGEGDVLGGIATALLSILALPFMLVAWIGRMRKFAQLAERLTAGSVTCPYCEAVNPLNLMTRCPSCGAVEPGSRLRCSFCGAVYEVIACGGCDATLKVL